MRNKKYRFWLADAFQAGISVMLLSMNGALIEASIYVDHTRPQSTSQHFHGFRRNFPLVKFANTAKSKEFNLARYSIGVNYWCFQLVGILAPRSTRNACKLVSETKIYSHSMCTKYSSKYGGCEQQKVTTTKKKNCGWILTLIWTDVHPSNVSCRYTKICRILFQMGGRWLLPAGLSMLTTIWCPQFSSEFFVADLDYNLFGTMMDPKKIKYNRFNLKLEHQMVMKIDKCLRLMRSMWHCFSMQIDKLHFLMNTAQLLVDVWIKVILLLPHSDDRIEWTQLFAR